MKKVLSLLLLCAGLGLMLVACGDPHSKEKRESGRQMEQIWNAVSIYQMTQGAPAQGINDIVTLSSRLAREMTGPFAAMRDLLPAALDRSPMATHTSGVALPHYRLLSTEATLSPQMQQELSALPDVEMTVPEAAADPRRYVVIESPELYENRGTQVLDANGTVHWVDAEKAAELWQQGR